MRFLQTLEDCSFEPLEEALYESMNVIVNSNISKVRNLKVKYKTSVNSRALRQVRAVVQRYPCNEQGSVARKPEREEDKNSGGCMH